MSKLREHAKTVVSNIENARTAFIEHEISIEEYEDILSDMETYIHDLAVNYRHEKAQEDKKEAEYYNDDPVSTFYKGFKTGIYMVITLMGLDQEYTEQKVKSFLEGLKQYPEALS